MTVSTDQSISSPIAVFGFQHPYVDCEDWDYSVEASENKQTIK